MNSKPFRITLLFILFFQILLGQKPQKLNSVEIFNQIQKLNFLGSVLYIAAHPDDENTRLISYLANEKKARTAYLSITRGDGGQNLIGPQLGELLGVIRTQELIEARKIDGGEQLFTRAIDFGFSKTPEETFKFWDKNKIESDVVWAIRKFQPDVIINRFDHRTSGNTHGHHTASAILSVESFDLTNNLTAFPGQLTLVKPWQVKRQFFNSSVWFYGSQEKFDAVDKSNFTTIETGVYYPNLGKSNPEISALSRSSHQSQGFGSTGFRGEEKEYLELINGEPLKDIYNIFEGIDTSWNRLKNGKEIGELFTEILSKYDFKNPSKSIPSLIKAYQMIQKLSDSNWKILKIEELKNVIASCAGLYLEAVSNTQEVVPGNIIKLNIEAINRSEFPIELTNLNTFPDGKINAINKDLKNNIGTKFNITLQLPPSIEYTQPYWLKEEKIGGIYTVLEQKNIGIPDIIREVKVIFNIKIIGVNIPIERTVVYKNNDPVKGEMYFPLDIVPQITTSIQNKVLLFTNENPKTINVKVKAGKDNCKGNVTLEIPKDWSVSPENYTFNIEKNGMEQQFKFTVTPSIFPSEVFAKSIVTVDNEKFDKEQINIEFPHINKQQVLKSAETKLIKMDLKIAPKRIGYIMGAGDEVPESLRQMGFEVTLIKPEEITPNRLTNFDVIITGIRTYNTEQEMVNRQQFLFDFIKNGKTMIVQYNTPKLIPEIQLAPYNLQLSNDRVTEENTKVHFLIPNHPVLNFPNPISTYDFECWVQEQGLYYPDKFDTAFTSIITSNDTGENPKNGALLVAQYGKGYYIYTGLSFFRELPEGVTGAYKLMANLISIQNSSNQTSKN